ncbi:MAG: DUF367 family protein [Candidatus Nitrosothermus koennekii]|nr:MAG: DUF367 family protein [Candidatus Nitrosothermus koennekii]
MQLFVYMLEQDDPKRCTAAKLNKFGIVKRVRNIPKASVLLDPFSTSILSKNDKPVITALDCSWNNPSIFKHKLKGIRKRLPLLFAGNPINYAKPNKLSTAEALAAACIILGYKEKGEEIMNKFKWGHTFLELNEELFYYYTKAEDEEDMRKIEEEYITSLYG